MGRRMATMAMRTPSGMVTVVVSTSMNPNDRYSGTPGSVAISASARKPDVPGRALTGLQDRPAQTSAGPVLTDEHRPHPGRFGRGVQQTGIRRVVTGPGVQPVPLAPATAGDDVAFPFVHEVGPVVDQRFVDVRDMDCRTAGLLVVVEPREQFDDRRSHQDGDLRHIRRDGETLRRNGPRGIVAPVAGLRGGRTHAQ